VLGEVRALVLGQLPPTTVEPDEARRTAREILSRREYQPPERSLIDRAWGWFQDQLDALLAGVGGAAGGYWVGIAVLLTALAAATWFAVRVLPRPRRRTARPTAPAAVDLGTRPTRDQLLAAATEAEAEGRWADAVSHRYRALVAGLADGGRLPDDPAATSGELRRALRAGDDDRRLFDQASTSFELVRYRGDPAGPDDPARLVEWDRRLVGEGSR
jgi:hypothetical protein